MQEINELNNVMFKEFPDCVGVQELQKMLGIKRTKTYELLRMVRLNLSKLVKITKFQNLMSSHI